MHSGAPFTTQSSQEQAPPPSQAPVPRRQHDGMRAMLWLALLLAFVLRLERPTLVEFKRDEATVVRMAQAIAYEGYLPAAGVDSSVGIDNLPLTLYLMALPLRLWNDPVAAVVFTAFLNAAAVVACYFVARTYLNERAALVATFLFSVNPWAVLYARKIWSHPLPLFSLAFMACLFAAFVRGRRWALTGAFVSLAGLLGLQLEALVFVPILGVCLILYRDQIAWKPLLAGVAIFLLLMSPYLIYDATHQWENVRGALAYASPGERAFAMDALRFPFMLATSAGIEGQAGGFHLQFQREVPPLWWLNTVMTGVLIAALIYAIFQARYSPTLERRRLFTMQLVWFCIPVVLQLRPSSATHLHYFVSLYPVQFLLIGALLDAGMKRWPWPLSRTRSALSGTALCVMAALALWGAWQGAVIYKLRAYMAEHPATGGYGIPLAYTRTAARTAIELADTAEIIVIGTAARPKVTETPTVFDALLFGHPHRFADGRNALPVPAANTVVYLVGPMQDTADDPLTPIVARLAALPSVEAGPATILPDGLIYRTFICRSRDHGDVSAGMAPLAAGIPLANKVVFSAVELPQTATAGASMEVWLTWWLQGWPPANVDYHITVQLFDGAGRLAAQSDHAGFPADSWQIDDIVLNRFVLPLPETLPGGIYTLRAGMYTYPDITGVPVVDPNGNPIDDGVTLGTVLVQ
ncbi:MAG: DUF2079 domain-containing protein [Anaerolineae bacterium]|nr:DUF2079 domain-containing protein [Anaerolineae bacterium]